MISAKAGVVRDCLDQLQAVRHDFSKRFYRKLLDRIPEAAEMFVQDPRQQEMMTFAVVSMMVKGIESRHDLNAEMAAFGRIHRKAGVTEEMFPVFGAVFLETLIEFLPEFDHPELAQAWWGVYTEICEALIDGMRAEAGGQHGEQPVFTPNFARAG